MWVVLICPHMRFLYSGLKLRLRRIKCFEKKNILWYVLHIFIKYNERPYLLNIFSWGSCVWHVFNSESSNISGRPSRSLSTVSKSPFLNRLNQNSHVRNWWSISLTQQSMTFSCIFLFKWKQKCKTFRKLRCVQHVYSIVLLSRSQAYANRSRPRGIFLIVNIRYLDLIRSFPSNMHYARMYALNTNDVATKSPRAIL